MSKQDKHDDEHMVRFSEMVKTMQYLTDEVNNLRYKLLQYDKKAKKVSKK